MMKTTVHGLNAVIWRQADGLVNLYCWAHIRRYVVRAGDANPAQLKNWTAAWLDRIKANSGRAC